MLLCLKNLASIFSGITVLFRCCERTQPHFVFLEVIFPLFDHVPHSVSVHRTFFNLIKCFGSMDCGFAFCKEREKTCVCVYVCERERSWMKNKTNFVLLTTSKKLWLVRACVPMFVFTCVRVLNVWVCMCVVCVCMCVCVKEREREKYCVSVCYLIK